MTNKIIPVILSGGSGTRLWPLSRAQYPKQYLRLLNENTMLQETILRLEGINNLSEPIVICNSDHRFFVAEQMQQIDIDNPTILLEPNSRNTAPAIAAAAFQALKNGNDNNTILLILSADHSIENIRVFHDAIKIGAKQALEGKLVTFGVQPKNANTNYGYIKGIKDDENKEVYLVEEFIEKPNQKNAEKYIKQGNYLWNSGIFMFDIETIIKELTLFSKEMIMYVKQSVENSSKDLDFIHLEKKSFRLCPDDSIDYALMEKSDNVVVVPLASNWSDIGSWHAIYDAGIKDNNGNVIQGDVFHQETINSYIYAKHHLVATIGLKDLVIVDTPNATLIASKVQSHKIDNILSQLKQQEREEQHSHRKVYRPWGWYDSIETGKNFQVKRLHINPGAKLSLQKHDHRAEHWVVVKGTATAVKGEDLITLTEGQSIYIPVSVKHSLENLEDIPLEIIEVQSGSYLGEDDIVRLEDIYGRI